MARVQHLFIVRIWYELDTDSLPMRWRGSVEHVPSGERRYFTSLQDLATFIASQLQISV